MSGFEVAGLVLGSISLLISGLEHYSKSVEVLKNVKHYECVFADINSSLAVSVGIYTESCYKLLAPLNLSDAQMKDLLSEKDSLKMREAWKDVELEKKLSRRLGANCKGYLSFVDKLNRRIVRLAHKLKLGPDFKPPWVSKDGKVNEKARNKFFSSTWTRLVGGFESNKCATLLQDIDRDISKIAHLTDIATEIEPLRVNRRSRIRSSFWTGIRDSAHSLSEILRQKWTNPCTCQYSHRASMQLNPQTDHHTDKDEENGQASFALLVTFESPAIPSTLKWQDVEIQSVPMQHVASGVQSRGVRFNISPPPSPPLAGIKSKTNAMATHQASKIHDLCKSLASQNPRNCCIGFLEDQKTRHHFFLVSGPGDQNQVVSEASLHHLLLETHKVVLGPREKCTLAFALANAVLQLYDTPWLVTAWDLRDISLLKDTKGNYLRDRAYVSLSLGPGTVNKSQAAHRRRPVKNEIVFALGIALLELSHSHPLIDLAESVDLDENGNRDIMTEYCTATRLARDIHLRELPNYAKAVLRCVHCNFDTFLYDLSEQEFRERFYEGVVVPLREDWEYATK